MRNEFKLLNYKDIREDDRDLTVIYNDRGQIVLWNPHIRIWEGDETEEETKILEQADEKLTDSAWTPDGTGWTIEEAIEDYINKINKKTLCFQSSYDNSLYLVTFDFDDPSKYIDDEDDDDWDEIFG